MKRFASLLCSLALAALALPAHASVSVPVVVNWTAPTVGCSTINGVMVNPCDNIPLTGGDAITGYDVYMSTSVIPDNFSGPPTVSVQASANGVQTNFAVNSGQTIHVRVKVKIASGGTSSFSNEATQTVTLGVVPQPPTSVTVQLVIS